MADITYTFDGLFYRIIPETKEAEENIYNPLYAEFGYAIPLTAWPSVAAQIKAAGYTVRKARASGKSVDDILAELE